MKLDYPAVLLVSHRKAICQFVLIEPVPSRQKHSSGWHLISSIRLSFEFLDLLRGNVNIITIISDYCFAIVAKVITFKTYLFPSAIVTIHSELLGLLVWTSPKRISAVLLDSPTLFESPATVLDAALNLAIPWDVFLCAFDTRCHRYIGQIINQSAMFQRQWMK